ncbi:MAG: hydantoinase B/oxoprolinase family protein [Candidatus Saliniplasma sp.]
MTELTPTDIEVMKHAFISIAELMGASLQRSAYSSNIKERKDESCAVFSKDGEMISQAEHIPVHLGAMPKSLDSALEHCEMEDGDQIILNDPYAGGTHLPDITIIKPVFDGGLIGYVVNRAHHADVGGDIPGSMPGKSKILDEEGVVISPTHIVKKGKICQDVLNIFNSTRNPKERRGDLQAQIGANERGAQELIKNVKRFGPDKFNCFIKEIIDYSEARTRKILRELPMGELCYMDHMEWEPKVKLNVKISIEKDSITFDFAGTDKQVEGNINAPSSVTHSAIYYVLRCLLPEDVPVNQGCYRPLSISIPKGCVLNPKPPAAVSSGNVETSQRVVELIFRALQDIFPDKICAESQGTMNNLVIGNKNFTYYETIGGGAGGCSCGPGESGVHVHMTNTKNTPIEALEKEYPLRIHAYRLRKGSGGAGKNKGGDGLIRDIEALEDAHLSIQSERRIFPPKGIYGGEDGEIGNNILIKKDKNTDIGGKVSLPLSKGDRVRIETPGGGGWGKKTH